MGVGSRCLTGQEFGFARWGSSRDVLHYCVVHSEVVKVVNFMLCGFLFTVVFFQEPILGPGGPVAPDADSASDACCSSHVWSQFSPLQNGHKRLCPLRAHRAAGVAVLSMGSRARCSAVQLGDAVCSH